MLSQASNGTGYGPGSSAPAPRVGFRRPSVKRIGVERPQNPPP
uniref:Uncharacterized protein n=1 Tax=uncultured Armatimonadetes bacterium TaxID=157466 RepID=A0A6J4K112_9BACT|nr:hypothetical protein AVDCRST_MAG63-4524 [uncultured Armatimonadetes bacterium]